ncbi:MAG: prepilin-type N-terminal cleavage/methylation domain-containing protein [Rhodoferax sp.]|nr:prepilin-type N-terminal cleavage/methylation domain-containing protein [Rhodoferax sp.]
MKINRCMGFTLIEMAIALLIMGLLLGGGLTVLSAQIEQQRFKDTERLLVEAREAVIGFALANGRMPCPASATSAGRESFCTNAAGACGAAIVPPPAAVPAHGRCTNPNDGFLPASTLGFSPVDPAGYAMDAWGLPQNRLHYAVTASNASAFTTPQWHEHHHDGNARARPQRVCQRDGHQSGQLRRRCQPDRDCRGSHIFVGGKCRNRRHGNRRSRQPQSQQCRRQPGFC